MPQDGTAAGMLTGDQPNSTPGTGDGAAPPPNDPPPSGDSTAGDGEAPNPGSATPPPAAGETPGFFDGISSENLSVVQAKKWDQAETPNLDMVLDALRGAEELIGSNNAIQRPSAANPKDWEGWDHLGVPKDATGYELTKPELPKGMQYDEKLEAKFLETAAENKVPPYMAQAMMDTFASHMADGFTSVSDMSKEMAAKEMNGLRQDWGDDYDANEKVAQAAWNHLDLEVDENGPHPLEVLEAQIGGAALVKLFHKLGTSLGEDVVAPASGGGFGQTREGAQAELDAKKQDAGWVKAWEDKNDPGHEAAVREYQALQRKIHG